MTVKKLYLLSSNSRRRYAEDILTALASPSGATLQFRYEDEYVVSAIDRDVAKEQIVGAAALLIFVADIDSPEPFVIPVRHATVVAAKRPGNIFVFRLRLDEYVELDQYPRELESIRQTSRDFIAGLKSANKGYYPAVYSAPDLRVKKSARSEDEAWQETALRLALHQTFTDSYFLRVNTPVTQQGNSLHFNADGQLEVVDQQTVRISASFYSAKYDPNLRPVLLCSADGKFLRISSDASYEISHRYDTMEFWVHPTALSYETLSRLTISLTDTTESSAVLAAYVPLPFVVKKLSSRLIARLATTSIGALLVALPAILGVTTPVPVRILSAIFGAALLAFASIILGPTA